MSIVNRPHTYTPNTTISSSDANANENTIYNDYNGNISAANLADNAVTTAKIADSNVTTAKIADSNVTTAKIADESVTNAKLDTGAGQPGGAWTTWTPTFVNLSGGTLNFSKYTQIGKTIHYRIKYTLAGAGVAGAVTFTLPVNAHADYSNANEIMDATGSVFDANGALHNIIVRWASASTFSILVDNVSGSYGQSSNLSSTVPFTWASGDFITVNGTYEAA